MRLLEALRAATDALQQAGIPSPKADAEWLLVCALGATRAVLLESNRVLTQAQLKRYQAWVARRAAREPLQWILGSSEFYGLELELERGVLIPRPETERLVELALERLPKFGRIVDVGCGSGAIALALKAERPALEVWATDINPLAVALTLRNARRLGLTLQVRQTSLLDGLEGDFAAIISNPPYLPSGDPLEPEVQQEPPEALFGGNDGLDLARLLVRCATNNLLPQAWLMLELDPRNVAILQQEMQQGAQQWHSSLAADLAGRTRFLFAQRL
ncbi:MAG: peptide chain release factor N(5)-glutamine methyltransferase [Deinococcales bacterium]